MLFSEIFFMASETIPAVILCFLYVLLFAVISQAGLLVFNLCYSKNKRGEQSNDVAGLIFGTISLIYSLILAFVIVAVWTNYDDLNQTIEKETDKLNSILAHTVTLTDTLSQPLGHIISAYCSQVINNEWRMQGTDAVHHPSAIPGLRLKLLQLEPQNKIQENVYAVLDDDLNCISDLRRARLDHTRSHVPALVWLVLKTGSVMLIIFSYLLNSPSEKLKRIYLFFLSSIIAMSLFLVYTLDHPFDGSAQVSNKPYQNILLELKQNWNYSHP